MIRRYRAWRRRMYVHGYLMRYFVGRNLDSYALNKFYEQATSIAYSKWPEPSTKEKK